MATLAEAVALTGLSARVAPPAPHGDGRWGRAHLLELPGELGLEQIVRQFPRSVEATIGPPPAPSVDRTKRSFKKPNHKSL